MNVSTNYNMRYPKDVVHHSDVIIKPNTHDNLQHRNVSYPSDPSRSLLLWDYGDVATFEVQDIMLLAHDEMLSRPASSVMICFSISMYLLPQTCGLLCKQSISTLLAGSQVWDLREARPLHSLLHPIWAIPRCRRNGDLHWLSRHAEEHLSFLSWMFASCMHLGFVLCTNLTVFLGLLRSFDTQGSLKDFGH